VTDQGISDPELYISSQDSIKSIAVSPDGGAIAYTLDEQIWVSDIHGNHFQRLTGFSSGYNMFPEWSPDGRYIAFKHMDYDNHSPLDYSKVWVVVADGRNIQIHETGNTTNAIPIMRGDR
jgi:Tol biopolymer transport system component